MSGESDSKETCLGTLLEICPPQEQKEGQWGRIKNLQNLHQPRRRKGKPTRPKQLTTAFCFFEAKRTNCQLSHRLVWYFTDTCASTKVSSVVMLWSGEDIFCFFLASVKRIQFLLDVIRSSSFSWMSKIYEKVIFGCHSLLCVKSSNGQWSFNIYFFFLFSLFFCIRKPCLKSKRVKTRKN